MALPMFLSVNTIQYTPHMEAFRERKPALRGL
jgi:hypothetical protein